MICSICGTGRNVENAHIVSKGMGGDPAGHRTDTAPLCAGTGGNTDARSCHGAHHAGLLSLRRDSFGTLTYCPTDTYAKVLRRRGVKCHAGRWHAAMYEHADPDHMDAPEPVDDNPRDGDMEHECEAAYREVAQADYAVFRCRSERLQSIRDRFLEAYGGDGPERFRSWRLSLTDAEGNPMPVTDTQASRMLTVADNLPQDVARHLPAMRQIYLATAVRDGVGDLAELLPHAESLTARAFAEEFLGAEPPTEKRLCCPACAYEGGAGEFRKEESCKND